MRVVKFSQLSFWQFAPTDWEEIKLLIISDFSEFWKWKQVGFVIRKPWLRTWQKKFSTGSWLNERNDINLKPAFKSFLHKYWKPLIVYIQFLIVGTLLFPNFILSKTNRASFQNSQWIDVDVTALRNSFPGWITVEQLLHCQIIYPQIDRVLQCLTLPFLVYRCHL